MSNEEIVDKQFSLYQVIKIEKNENVLIWLLYKITFPLAKFFSKFAISPNTLTMFSLLLVGLANYLLIIQGHPGFYSLIWITAILFDFIDGQVARITGKTRSHSFSFDHTSDLLKISSSLISIAIHHSTDLIWIVTYISMCTILLSDRLNTDLAIALKAQQGSSVNHFSKLRNPFTTNLYTILLTFNAHSLFLLPFTIISERICAVILLYFIVISTISCARFIYVLTKLPRTF